MYIRKAKNKTAMRRKDLESQKRLTPNKQSTNITSLMRLMVSYGLFTIHAACNTRSAEQKSCSQLLMSILMATRAIHHTMC